MDNKIYSINEIADKIESLLIQFNVKKAAVFGSYAREEANSKSDVDLLMKFDENFGFIEFSQLEDRIKRSLRKKVDVLSFDYINEYMKEEILREAVTIYESWQNTPSFNY